MDTMAHNGFRAASSLERDPGFVAATDMEAAGTETATAKAGESTAAGVMVAAGAIVAAGVIEAVGGMDVETSRVGVLLMAGISTAAVATMADAAADFRVDAAVVGSTAVDMVAVVSTVADMAAVVSTVVDTVVDADSSLLLNGMLEVAASSKLAATFLCVCTLAIIVHMLPNLREAKVRPLADGCSLYTVNASSPSFLKEQPRVRIRI